MRQGTNELKTKGISLPLQQCPHETVFFLLFPLHPLTAFLCPCWPLHRPQLLPLDSETHFFKFLVSVSQIPILLAATKGDKLIKVWEIVKITRAQGLPWGLGGEELACQSLIWEDSTCHGASKPVCHNYWACALEPGSCSYWAHMPQVLKPVCLEPVLYNKRNHRNEKSAHGN